MTVIIIAIVAGICALLFAVYLAREVMAHDTGTDTMRSIAAAIQEGASAFLYRTYLYISVFVTTVPITPSLPLHPALSFSFAPRPASQPAPPHPPRPSAAWPR